VTGAAKLHGDLFTFPFRQKAFPMIVRSRDRDGKMMPSKNASKKSPRCMKKISFLDDFKF
jgi:hypothetical protein